MDRSLDSVSCGFKLVLFEVLARLVERTIPVLIVQTSRTLAEHQANLANGTSWTTLSKHLPRRLRLGSPPSNWADAVDSEQCDAIDLAPYEIFLEHGPDKLNYDPSDPAWYAIGAIGEGLGLRWGGRWARKDLGHLEWLLPDEHYADIPPTSAAYAAHGGRKE